MSPTSIGGGPLNFFSGRTNLSLKALGIDGFSPDVSESSEWTRWQTNFGPFTCAYCAEMHGDIFHKDNPPEPMPGEVHPNCNCTLIVLLCIKAGTATIAGLSGADYYIKYYGLLPENYLSKDEARAVGWKRYKGNLRDVTSNGTIGGDIYRNRNNNLPTAAGRIWYEADITKRKMSPASIGGRGHLTFFSGGTILLSAPYIK